MQYSYQNYDPYSTVNANGFPNNGLINYNGYINPIQIQPPTSIINNNKLGLDKSLTKSSFLNKTTSKSWFDKIGGLSGIGSLLSGMGQAYSGLMGYKLGKQQLGLAREQFGFEKGLANRNLANQAQLVNTQYNNAAMVAAGMAGNRGTASQDILDRYAQAAKERHVDGSPIG